MKITRSENGVLITVKHKSKDYDTFMTVEGDETQIFWLGVYYKNQKVWGRGNNLEEAEKDLLKSLGDFDSFDNDDAVEAWSKLNDC